MRVTLVASATILALVGTVAESRTPMLQASVARDLSAIGTVVGYNVKTRLLTIHVEKKTETFTVPARASLRFGSRLITAEQINRHAGDRVKVRYTDSSSGHVAVSVMLSTASR